MITAINPAVLANEENKTWAHKHKGFNSYFGKESTSR